MRLLDRYLLRELLLPLGFCLGGFLVFWAAFDLLANLSELQNARMTGMDIVEYYVLSMPEIVVIILPVALLLALLYALTHHARSNELTAMRAAGISLWRLAAPYLAVGFLSSLLALGVSELVVPRTAVLVDAIKTRRLQAPEAGGEGNVIRGLGFNNGRERRSWFIGLYDLDRSEMNQVQVGWYQPDGTIARLFADRGVYTNGSWTFFGNVIVQQQTSVSNALLYPAVTTNCLAMTDFTESPAFIRTEVKISGSRGLGRVKQADLPVSVLLDYLHVHPRLTGADHAWVHTKLQGRLAAPWTCLVVVLIAIPFGAPSGRRNVFFGVAGSIFICFAYFVLMQVGLALGSRGVLPAWLAAWLPNLAFAVLSFVLIARVR